MSTFIVTRAGGGNNNYVCIRKKEENANQKTIYWKVEQTEVEITAELLAELFAPIITARLEVEEETTND